jgi:NAD(P)-dependent dehydrogenase (short-subunit alcohol dehydrogenase family)
LKVTRPSDFVALKARIGVAPIGVLISNAAIAIDPMSLGAIDYEFAARIFDVNTIEPLRLVEALWSTLQRARTARSR